MAKELDHAARCSTATAANRRPRRGSRPPERATSARCEPGSPRGSATARSKPESAVAFAVGRVGITAAAVVGQVVTATQPERIGSPKIVWNRVTANIGSDSVVLRNGLRLALALAAARAVAGAFDLSHGFWVVFATLSVTRGTARQTGATAWKAVQGTLLGAAIATPLIVALESESEVWVFMLPAITFLAVLAGNAGFVLGQAGFTLLIVGIFSLVGPAEWDVGSDPARRRDRRGDARGADRAGGVAARARLAAAPRDRFGGRGGRRL